MKQTRLLFIDRDGTLIQEPADEQIDSFEKLVFTKGVFRNLAFIAQHTDYELVMVSNQVKYRIIFIKPLYIDT